MQRAVLTGSAQPARVRGTVSNGGFEACDRKCHSESISSVFSNGLPFRGGFAPRTATTTAPRTMMACEEEHHRLWIFSLMACLRELHRNEAMG